MKSPKPNDPVRLTVKGYGKPKADKYGDTITVPVYVEYSTWCCTQAHEYGYAFKCIADLFERTEELRERTSSYVIELEQIVDTLIANKPLPAETQNTIANRLNDMARKLRSIYGDEDEN